MRSISGMLSDELAGAAKRCVLILVKNALRQTETLCVKVPGLFLATFD